MLGTLRRIVQAVTAQARFANAVQTLVTEVKVAMAADVCTIYLINPARTHFVLAATDGLNLEKVGSAEISLSDGLVGQVARRAEPLNLNDARSHPSFLYLADSGEEAVNSFLGVPIIHQGRTLGVLVVQQQDARRFDESEEAFLVTLAAQLATVVAHADAVGESALGVQGGELKDTCFTGAPGAPGIAIGTAVVVHPVANLEAVPEKEAENVTIELLLFDRALESVRSDIRNIILEFSESLPAQELALFEAYLHMLDENALAGDIRERIQHGQWSQGALKQVIREHVNRFEEMEDPYLRERGADVRDLGLRLLAYLQDIRDKKTHFPKDTVLVGDEVTPAVLANVPADRLRAIVSMRGSRNSHMAILARAMDIPAVMGAVELPAFELEGEELLVDGHYGEVYTRPSDARIRLSRELIEQERTFDEELNELKELPCITRDGWRLALWVNIGLTGDLTRSLDRGAEGIGLFRTEIPFMSKDSFPTEAEQYTLYREHMEAFEPRPVTMRTLDIGGDKSLSYFPIQEENPFLGWRGIRVTLDHPEIMLVQVRAMLKANAGLKGLLRIMLPMISSLQELQSAKGLINQAYDEVIEEGVTVKRPQVGVMIEVPAAVYQARQLAKESDFLAVGSNDLTQYMLAVDRNNARVAELYQDVHPAVVTALREVARAAHAEETPLGICGEFAGTPIGAVLLMAMGYHVLSMNATHLPKVKWVIRNIKRSDARRMLARVLRMDNTQDIERFMDEQLRNVGLAKALPHHHD
ncbi:MAG: phosphoenolpyruvate--protein phosphotransferase [Pseudomonadales bacterium]|nr:phosphoenolpyruvate--protein phosphotransferase [Pseudomonadales bacterium]